MTQFKCECCGKEFELDKAVVIPNPAGDPIYICETCDETTNKGKRLGVCNYCGNVFETKELILGTNGVHPVVTCTKCADKYSAEITVTPDEAVKLFESLELPSENTCVCCGEVIPEGEQVCLHCQRIEHPLYLEKLKRTHAKLSDLGEWNVEKKDTPVDIHKIIDDAMEKRDRTVSIFIRDGDAHITINPYEDEKAYWIYHEDTEKYHFECSNCGIDSEFQTVYCPSCGEQMHGLKRHVDMAAIMKKAYEREQKRDEEN